LPGWKRVWNPEDSTVPATRKTAEDDDDEEEDWDVTLNRLRDSLA
jgi:hypothetical protein